MDTTTIVQHLAILTSRARALVFRSRTPLIILFELRQNGRSIYTGGLDIVKFSPKKLKLMHQ